MSNRAEMVEFARKRLGISKEAYAPMPPGPPEAQQMMEAGPPPMDPAMAGGQPPMDPAMAGGQPPMDPAAGGAPPPPPDPMQMMMEMMDAVGQGLMQIDERMAMVEDAVGKIAEIVGAVEPGTEEPVGGQEVMPPQPREIPPEAMPMEAPQEGGIPPEAMMGETKLANRKSGNRIFDLLERK